MGHRTYCTKNEPGEDAKYNNIIKEVDTWGGFCFAKFSIFLRK